MIEITKTSKSKREAVDFSSLAFGNVFSDHMFVADYGSGFWEAGKIIPYGPIALDPAFSVLHYGQAVFEGLKAFAYTGSGVNIFRADRHYDRFVRSSNRMNIPVLPKEIWDASITYLVDLDRAWVPAERYKSLYIRPIVMATDEYLGLRTSARYKYLVITGPVGNYYAEGIKPVKLTTMTGYSRAVPGGAGDAKVPGNYGPCLKPAEIAMKDGYTQIVWLDSVHKEYVEEVGTSNIFFVLDGTLITPALNGTILAGITRENVIYLAKSWGIKVEERPVSIHEIMDASEHGALNEMFATGTAAVVSPIGSIHHKGRTAVTDEKNMGKLAARLYKTITGIHHGEISDPDNWCNII